MAKEEKKKVDISTHPKFQYQKRAEQGAKKKDKDEK
jgi:hypothetical protein